MHEVELKFQVAEAERAAVARAVAGRAPKPRQRLLAIYLDTPGRALAQAALALRLRREGGRWMQTLKGAGDDGMTRLEHNVVLAARGARAPAVDPARHADTPAGQQLAALLQEHPEEPLAPVHRTDVRRRVRTLRRPGATLELCFDEGVIVSGDRSVPVCELEIELLAGSPAAVIDEARRWVERFGVTLDARSKAERGDLLARGISRAPARTARGAVLDAAMTPAQALRALIRLCADQVVCNASQIAAGDHGPEHVHQMRVGLRRLRSALELFEREDGLLEGAKQLFRRLGAVRDADVLGASLGTALSGALEAAGLPGPPIAWPASTVSDSAVGIVSEAAAQALLLDLVAAGLDGEAAPADGEPLRDRLAARIARWHRSAGRAAARYAQLDDAARHTLRKRIKRLRYAVEFAAALFAPKAVRRYLVPLKALQERLGEVNDVVVAIEALARLRGAGPFDERLAFAHGWLVARRDALVERAAPELAAFAKAKPFWKN